MLEYYPTDARMTDVGGLDQLKIWLERRGKAFGAGARDFGLDAPKGVLLLGVQGCGKSLLAKAVAATWQFPLLRFDMGKRARLEAERQKLVEAQRATVQEKAKKLGYQVKETREADTIRLVLVKRTY